MSAGELDRIEKRLARLAAQSKADEIAELKRKRRALVGAEASAKKRRSAVADRNERIRQEYAKGGWYYGKIGMLAAKNGLSERQISRILGPAARRGAATGWQSSH